MKCLALTQRITVDSDTFKMEQTSFRVIRSDFCIASPFLILIKGGVCLCKMCTDVHALYVFIIPFFTINLKFFVPPFLFFYAQNGTSPALTDVADQ